MSIRQKPAVWVRTYRIDGSGKRILEREEVLRDDPKNGVYDLSKWYRKYAAFAGSHTSRKSYPSRYRDERTVWHPKKPGGTSYSPFPTMTETQHSEFYDFFMSQRGLYLDFIAGKIADGDLRDDLKLDALESIYDGVRAAYLKYDPKHPPKYRSNNGGNSKSASRETFFVRVARNTLADYIDFMSAEKRGGQAIHLSISEKSKNETLDGEISAESLEDRRHGTVKNMEFQFDVEILRRRLPAQLRTVLEFLLQEWPHSLIQRTLAVSNDKYLRQYLSPIQKLAAELGFEPANDDAFIDKMYVFHRKVQKMRRGNERNNVR